MYYVLATFGDFDLLDPRARCKLEHHASYEDVCKRLWSKWKEFRENHLSNCYSVYSHSLIYYIIKIENNGKGHVVSLGRIKNKKEKDDESFEVLRRMLP